MKTIIKITIWIYNKLGYTICITNKTTVKNGTSKLFIATNGNVGI